MLHPLGVMIAFAFVLTLGGTLFWMLKLPRPMAQEVARAVYSVAAARVIVVPILDLYYTERAVELACRLGRQQGAIIVLSYVVEVPRLLTLDSPLPPEIKERAEQALKHAKSIVERHGLKVSTSEGIGRAVQTYGGDMVVLGVHTVEHRVPGIFARTGDALMRRPPCEVLIDSVPD
jgi:nucleotide-binding universal stress UspA family protein